MLIFYLVLLAVSAIATLAGIASFFGIRSGRDALILVPGALLGIVSNAYLTVLCLFCYLLEGRNLGG